jgi:hypothetical protein
MSRQNTKLESEGAEFLVLGNLLRLGIPAYKAYTNMKGFDITAMTHDHKHSIRIQVKSRWATNASGFIIKDVDCDFVIFCRLNRGSKKQNDNTKHPEYFILPAMVVMNAPRSKNWGKLNLSAIPNNAHYKDNWNWIVEHLETMSR